MKRITIYTALICMFLFSCSNNAGEKAKEQATTAVETEHNHADEAEVIELNNGEKWTVDADMMVHIRNMENDMIAAAKMEQKDFHALAKKLETNVDLLTSNCTMKGKAHDELHKWLLPYIDMVNLLSNAKNNDEALMLFKNIESSFGVFNQYFQ